MELLDQLVDLFSNVSNRDAVIALIEKQGNSELGLSWAVGEDGVFGLAETVLAASLAKVYAEDEPDDASLPAAVSRAAGTYLLGLERLEVKSQRLLVTSLVALFRSGLWLADKAKPKDWKDWLAGYVSPQTAERYGYFLVQRLPELLAKYAPDVHFEQLYFEDEDGTLRIGSLKALGDALGSAADSPPPKPVSPRQSTEQRVAQLLTENMTMTVRDFVKAREGEGSKRRRIPRAPTMVYKASEEAVYVLVRANNETQARQVLAALDPYREEPQEVFHENAHAKIDTFLGFVVVPDEPGGLDG